VKRHAKASSAGSTKRRAQGLGCLFLAALFALLIFAIPASAGETHVKSISFGVAGSGDGQLELAEHSGVAVNETTHDVYVADTGNHRVDQFDSAGNFIRAFGADVGGAGVNVCTTGCVAGTPGSAPGAFEAPTFIAIDNSSGASAGDVYVADIANNIVSKFEANGTLVSGWGEGGQLKGKSPGSFGPIAGIAVDSSGTLAVFLVEPRVLFRFAEDGTFSAESGETPRGTEPRGLAVDPDGNFYKANGSPNVEKFEASGTDVGQVNTFESTTGLAADPSSGELYVDNGGSIDNFAFEPSGEVAGTGCTPAPFAGCPSSDTFGSGDLSAGAGLAVDGTSHTVYAADFGAAQVVAFEVAFLPSASTEAATGVDNDSALLHGKVSADGGPEASCEFQYTTKEAFELEGFENSTSIPCSPSGPFTGSAVESVSAEATGLTPSTDYRFRVVASNVEGAVKGQALGFRTASLSAIEEQSVESVGLNDATLSAKINPHGAKTTYHVEYGTTTAYGQSTPESAPVGFGGDESTHPVTVHIGGLASGTAYHFRFVATNVVGSTPGSDESFATYPSIASFGPCPNDRFRTGFGTQLPDCRAYEQVTPVDKHGANIQGSFRTVEAASGGNRITFSLNGGLPATGGTSSLSPYLASRGPSGWSSDGLTPLADPSFGALAIGWSEDLSTTLSTAPGPGNVGRAIYLRDSDTAAFNFGATVQFGTNGVSDGVAGFAADSSHFIYESKEVLAPGAVAGKQNVYDFDHGDLTLAGRIPAGSATSCDDEDGPACVPAPEGSFAGPFGSCGDEGGAICEFLTQNMISRDGSKVIFAAGGSRQLYVRENGTKTTRISASQRTTPDPNGERPALFMAATPDGSKVFFTSCEKLTDDSTAVSNGENRCVPGSFGESVQQGPDLYSYDTDTGELTDLTVDSNASDPLGAGVVGVLGASDDGSYVYFVANGVLAPGATPTREGCRPDGRATAAFCNLYVSHDGTVTFVGSLDGADSVNWVPRPGNFPKSSRVSVHDGTLLFSSVLSLTGYGNAALTKEQCGGGHIGDPCAELFRYTAPDEELRCVSCNPTGGRPSANAGIAGGSGFLAAVDPPHQTFLTRNLSADGKRVFFESVDPLLPSDTNGIRDVYEWEAKGSGSCETESQNGGCLYLLSSGTSSAPSNFADASVNGDHAFIYTSQQLVPGDHDQLTDIYDASTGGGLASQHELTPPTCSSTACQANPAPPPDQPTASSVFSGQGNVKPKPAARKCAKGRRKVRHAGKVRCQKAHKQHKHHTYRGGSK
jgi:NHL repeat